MEMQNVQLVIIVPEDPASQLPADLALTTIVLETILRISVQKFKKVTISELKLRIRSVEDEHVIKPFLKVPSYVTMGFIVKLERILHVLLAGILEVTYVNEGTNALRV